MSILAAMFEEQLNRAFNGPVDGSSIPSIGNVRPSSLALPGENPAELRKHIETICSSLNPVGQAEIALASQFAVAMWRVGRRDLWEASAAHNRTTGREHALRTPIYGLPRFHQAMGFPDTASVKELKEACILLEAFDRLPPTIVVSCGAAWRLVDTCFRVCRDPQRGDAASGWLADEFREWHAKEIGIADERVKDPFTGPPWTSDRLRRVFTRKAAAVGLTIELLCSDVTDVLRKQLRKKEEEVRDFPDEVRLAYQSSFLPVAIPEFQQAELLHSYGADSLREAERCLQMLLRIQTARRQAERAKTTSSSNRAASPAPLHERPRPPSRSRSGPKVP